MIIEPICHEFFKLQPGFANEFASNRLVNVENMSEEDLRVIQKFYTSLSKMAKNGESPQQTHSIDEAKRLFFFFR